jgi:hypothetical protein
MGVFVREATFVANLMMIYPKTAFHTWTPGIVLPLVNFVFCPLFPMAASSVQQDMAL